ncbi:beta-galactosidase (plasmid) [Deinococcus aetherius]|uniref:Beta-galactosidase n=1 Tax=Deinococcus aetherius TaxID=200252 RepID=A0ABN6RKR8_9DEIO|nr:sugar-binding domain-containing protein [Deinococcus aetherius]BDP43915.1 beta-galactosidase [Deinococcus aetherius]
MLTSPHPTPLLRRSEWRDLGGTWAFAFDPQGRWRVPGDVRYDRSIEVPYPPESQASGLHDTGPHPVVWYERTVHLSPEERPLAGRRLLLHFGAVDYAATVWVNGQHVTEHRGGHTPFHADVTEALGGGGDLTLTVRAQDDPRDLTQPRGKQDWLDEPHVMWHWRTTGIWQPVWLEWVPETHLSALTWTPSLDRWDLTLDARLTGPVDPALSLRTVLTLDGRLLADDRCVLVDAHLVRRIGLPDPGVEQGRDGWLWSPEAPQLIEATVELWRGETLVDRVHSYTALRSVGVDGRHFLLNGRPYFLRLALDQGYWPGTLLAADDAALLLDVERAKALGFNGVRQHQKLADPRSLYWCDVLGLLVWADMPSHYAFSTEAVERLVAEWTEAVRRDRSHPCVAAWVPFNESWGVPDLPTNPAHRDYVRALYHLTKTLDPTRPVIGNDGWEHVATDIVGVHDYSLDPAVLLGRYGTKAATEATLGDERPGLRPLFLDGFVGLSHPVVLSEFGGIDDAFSTAGAPGRQARDAEHLLVWYAELLAAVHACRGLAGFCYTQLTDTFYERNGLLHADRTPKAPLEALRAATLGPLAGTLTAQGYLPRWAARPGRQEAPAMI